MRGSRFRFLLAAPLVLAAAACSSPTVASSGAVPGTPSGSITVFAAASLERSFTELAESFEADHPGTRVRFSFAGSSDLAAQIVAGAPADVFASADERTMSTVGNAGLVAGPPAVIARNTLRIAVPPGNPASVASLEDLARDDVITVICAPQVPCGAAAESVQRAAGIRITPVSEELSVTDVLGKVASGEADAGLVYLTDILAAGDAVDGVDFPESGEAVNTYEIAQLTGTANRHAAAAFIAAVLGDAGRSALRDAGFGTPG